MNTLYYETTQLPGMTVVEYGIGQIAAGSAFTVEGPLSTVVNTTNVPGPAPDHLPGSVPMPRSGDAYPAYL